MGRASVALNSAQEMRGEGIGWPQGGGILGTPVCKRQVGGHPTSYLLLLLQLPRQAQPCTCNTTPPNPAGFLGAMAQLAQSAQLASPLRALSFLSSRARCRSGCAAPVPTSDASPARSPPLALRPDGWRRRSSAGCEARGCRAIHSLPVCAPHSVRDPRAPVGWALSWEPCPAGQ